jgi:protease I
MRLQEEGAGITVCGINAGDEYTSKHGCITAKAPFAAGDLKGSDYDAVLVPGGWAPDKLRRYDGVTSLVRDAHAAGKIVGLICHAGLVGISAGIVSSGRATGSLGIKDDLVNAGATWVDAPAFREGNIVWGRVVDDIPDYNRELIAALQSG